MKMVQIILVIEVYPGKQRPYYIVSEGKENGTYIRTNGSSRHADSTQLKELEFEGANKYFDQTYAVGHEVTEEQNVEGEDDFRILGR